MFQETVTIDEMFSENETRYTADITRFLCGEADWATATPEELEAGYHAMALDADREREAREWTEGLIGGMR